MYKIRHTTQFKKDLKKFQHLPKKLVLVSNCIGLLEANGVENIPPEMKPHKLKGNYQNMLECHILPDLLIIWIQIDEPTKEIRLIRLGSHAELF